MQLNLYKIIYEPEYPVPGGFAFILAGTPEAAKRAWIDDFVNEVERRYPGQSDEDKLATADYWREKYKRTEEIEGPFTDGFILCNISGDY